MGGERRVVKTVGVRPKSVCKYLVATAVYYNYKIQVLSVGICARSFMMTAVHCLDDGGRLSSAGLPHPRLSPLCRSKSYHFHKLARLLVCCDFF